ncbi:MAG: AAA family ATPase [Actinomycetota bacterium]
MSNNVLLGIGAPGKAAEVAALVHEDSVFTVVDVAADAEAVMAALRSWEVDAVVLLEDLGPIPVMDLARQIGIRFPGVGVVLVVRESTPEVLRAALQAGVRDVLTWRPNVEELQGALRGAIDWSTQLRERIAAGGVEEDEGLGTVGGMMVAVAGAKGGVGTTTMAVHLALAAATESGDRRVCLVDFDLQTGDVASLLALTHRRTVSDLVEVAGEISPRQLENTLYMHPSGLSVLLPPAEGERGEEVGADVARSILGGIKSHYDVVVVDLGSVVTEANAVVAEMAEVVIIVTTPDVPALRGVNRLVRLWERLHIRKKNDVRVLVNRVSRAIEVQPDLVGKVVEAPLLRSTVPAAFREVEAAANTGDPAALQDGGIRKALRRLAAEVGLSAPAVRRRSRAREESGAFSVETAGLASVLITVALLLWQIVLTGYTFVLAGHAAREGARELAVDGNVSAAVRADLPAGWLEGMKVDREEEAVVVSLSVPALAPGVETPFRITVRAGTVVEERGMPP